MTRAASLDKLPMLDALAAGRGCIFCQLEADDEKRVIEDYLRESVMDPEHRAEIEATGLCNGHVHLLLEGGDILGSAITINALLGAEMRAGLGADGQATSSGGGGVQRASWRVGRRRLGLPASSRREADHDCVFCRALEARARRRTDTFMRLYGESDDFRTRFSSSRALCVPHGRQLAAAAVSARALRPELRPALFADVNVILKVTAAELAAKLDWFIQKHDYRYQDSSWNGSENAPRETALFLLGRAGAGWRGARE